MSAQDPMLARIIDQVNGACARQAPLEIRGGGSKLFFGELIFIRTVAVFAANPALPYVRQHVARIVGPLQAISFNRIRI